MRLQIFRLLSTLVVLVIFLLSCDNPIALTPGTKSQNIVTGINITYEDSPEKRGVWGNPTFPEGIMMEPQGRECPEGEYCEGYPSYLLLENPYPNPSTSSFNIHFSLPQDIEVSVWIESAKWPGEDEVILPSNARSYFQRFVLIDNEIKAAGRHSLSSNTSNRCFGGNTNPGFYRVYFQAGDYLSWRDVYIYGPSGTNPPGLDDEYFTRFVCDPERTFDDD